MKKALWVLLLILCFFLESCNSDFSINDRQDVYVLNCILRNDTSIQYATISKNYFTENGTVPSPNSIEQNIKGVNIQIFNNDSVFVMRDTTVVLTNSGNPVQVDCYYLRNLVIIPGNIISIEAALPDGQILKSTVQVPVTYFALTNFPQSFYSSLNERGSYLKYPFYNWFFKNNNVEIKNVLSLPQLEIDYEKYEGGIYVNKRTLVPLAYGSITDTSGMIPSPDLNFSFNYYASTNLGTINKTMQEISGSDPFKNNYIINRVVFTINSLDPGLTRYYSAYEVYLNSVTIKLRPTDYSNIQGGKGIFGIYYKYSRTLGVDKAYINSFGYQWSFKALAVNPGENVLQ